MEQMFLCTNADGEITLPFGGDASSYSFEYTDQLTNTTIASANNVISGLLADTYDVAAIDGLAVSLNQFQLRYKHQIQTDLLEFRLQVK